MGIGLLALAHNLRKKQLKMVEEYLFWWNDRCAVSAWDDFGCNRCGGL